MAKPRVSVCCQSLDPVGEGRRGLLCIFKKEFGVQPGREKGRGSSRLRRSDIH